jgi:hypothetical protein
MKSKLDEALASAAKTNAAFAQHDFLSRTWLAGPNLGVIDAYLGEVRAHDARVRAWQRSRRGGAAKSTYTALVQTWTLPPAREDLFAKLQRIAAQGGAK